MGFRSGMSSRSCAAATVLLASTVSGAQIKWSDASTQSTVCPNGLGGDCVIPAGTEVLFDANADLGSLKIDGTLKWDLTKDDLTLKSGFIVAEGPAGTFEMGTPEKPMLNKATIYIKNNGKQHSSRLGSRVFGVQYNVGSPAGTAPSVKVHGRPLPKTWSLMVKNAEEGEDKITVEGNLADAKSGVIGGGNWKVGDRIGIAPAGMMGERIGEAFNIKAINFDGTNTVITLDANLEEPKLGRPDLKLQCEVVLLSRNVLMTGDDTSDSGQGWHGIAAAGQFAPDPRDGGVFQIEYARQERCGQARIKGSYCLHFHLMGDCGYDEANGGDPLRPRCIFRGNALENGYQRGLTVHGTHRSMVDNNVLWNVKGAGLYVEDGNEMGNKIQYNVNICPLNKGGCHNCKVWATDNGEADNGQQSGMWAMSPTNDFLFNRMVNHWNGFFMQTSFAPFGRGFAEFKVCTVNSPWGNFTGNVHHGNCRFGFYPDKNWPRRVDRSVATNGMVRDFHNLLDNNDDTWSSCQQFTKDGRDNGAPGIAADGLDWGNNLVGQYDLGDIQYLRYHSINNLHGMYWKATKNFARRPDWGSETWDIGTQGQPLQPEQLIKANALPWSHMKDCKFEWIDFWGPDRDIHRIMGSAASGVGHLYGPGGHGTFILEGGLMQGMMGAAVGSNQHCDLAGTGGLCAPTFEVNNVDFTKLHANTPLVFFGVSGGDSRMVSYAGQKPGDLPGPNGVNDWMGVAQAAQEYLLHLRDETTKEQLCKRAFDVNIETAGKFNWGIVCKRKLRRIQYFEKQLTPWPTIKIKTESHTPQDLIFIRPFHHLVHKRGYGMAVMPGFHYEIRGVENFPGENNAAFEFSDQIYGDQYSKYAEDTAKFTFIKKNGATRTCTVKSGHDRTWMGWEGNLAEKYGNNKAVGACLKDDSGSDGAPTTVAPTPPPTPAPPTPAPRPTPLPLVPVPAPSPIGPAPGDCKEGPCPYRTWPADMYECTVDGIIGTEIRTDGGMRKCNDCAERCWFQIPDCIGVLQGGLGEVESCTYYSAILGTVEGGSKRAIVKSLAFGSFQPIPIRPTPGTRTPDGCNSHVPPTQHDLGESMYMCLVSKVFGVEIDTQDSDASLKYYDDCAVRCFVQGIQARDGSRHTCVAVSADQIGDAVKCRFYSSIANLTTDTVGNIAGITKYAMIANSSVPWHMKASPSPAPAPQQPSNPVPNWLVPVVLVVGGVLLAGVGCFACRPQRKLYGPQVDATEMS